MKSFDEWWSEHKKNGFVPTFSDVASNAFKAGQQSKQAEVDELKREVLNKTNEAYADGQKSMRKMIKSNEDELQKRIDDVTYKLNNIKNDALRGHRHDYDKGWRDCAITILNDLKGNTNDH